MTNNLYKTLTPEKIPFPICIINGQGKVIESNSRMGEVFLYSEIKDTDIFVLTGIKLVDLIDEKKSLTMSRNGKVFKVCREKLDEEGNFIIYFQDNTNFENLKDMYNDEKMCIGIINVDNFDELINNTSEENMSSFVSAIDKMIRLWASRMNASLTRFKENQYLMVLENKYCGKLEELKFSILDDIRGIETEADFPVTLSIGIGIGGKNPAQIDEFAGDALELALGRGGDQAVIKRGGKIEYYGGKMQAVEKSNKGKSRIIGHALKQLIDQSDKVMIMGHRNPDMDSFGSALGIYRLASNIGREAHIVINTYNEALAEIFLQAKESENYSFINREKALEMITNETLVVVVDTHRPSMCECPELLEKTDCIAVIDHHRRAEEFIENPTLTYLEPYASSASELVTEILQYVGEKKSVQKLEVEALLAGISIDTNKFAVKTGVRTFEAASWLRRNGADTTAVKRFFQEDAVSFRIKANCIAGAEFIEGGVALSICREQHPNIQIINSQSADELLDIKGIKASFVAGRDDTGRTTISARSLGDINVQVIMEQFGGGGHLTTAGAQVDIAPEEVMEKLREIFRERAEKQTAGKQ